MVYAETIVDGKVAIEGIGTEVKECVEMIVTEVKILGDSLIVESESSGEIVVLRAGVECEPELRLWIPVFLLNGLLLLVVRNLHVFFDLYGIS